MSDRTPLQAIVVACPPAHADDVLALLEDHRLNASWGEVPALTDRVSLGAVYGNDAAPCGWAADLAAGLGELDGVAFKVWEDPRYEEPGELWIRVPSAGTFTAECDSRGRARFTTDQLRGLIGADGVLDRAATGLDHEEEFTLLRAENLHRVVDSDAPWDEE